MRRKDTEIRERRKKMERRSGRSGEEREREKREKKKGEKIERGGGEGKGGERERDTLLIHSFFQHLCSIIFLMQVAKGDWPS